MNWSIAELARRLKSNPSLAAENTALKLTGSPTSDTSARSQLPASNDQAETLYALLRVHAPDLYPLFIREYKFDRWRIDCASPSHLLAVEVNGGRWLPGGGKHATESDRKKIRRLQIAGWRVLEYTTDLLDTDPMGIIAEIREALGR